MRLILALAAVALLAGCICCGGSDIGLPGQTTDTTLTGGGCEAPYIRVGADCCLDDNGNGICDSDETAETTETTETTLPQEETQTTVPPEPATLPETVTTQAPTTTQAPSGTLQTTTTSPAAGPTCNDGVQNGGEEYVDCGGPCTGCTVMKLGGWQEYKLDNKGTGYSFRFDSKEGVDQSLKYWIEVKTPDGITDKRPLSTGESFVDYLRLKVINYGEDTPKIYVKVNTADLSTVATAHPTATLLTIGGQSCAQSATGMCLRKYNGYQIQMVSRFGAGGEKSATLWITPPGLAQSKIKVPESGIATVDGVLIVGGFFDNSHFIQGGYNLFYAYTI